MQAEEKTVIESKQAAGGQALEHESHAALDKNDLLRIAFVGLCGIAVWLHLFEPFAGFSVIGLIGTVFGGMPIFAEALHSLRERKMNMELSMSIAIVAAVSISEVVTALLVVFFVLIAEVLEKLTVSRGRSAIKSLLEMLPAEATVRVGGQLVTKALSELKPGDLILVRPGEKLPVDGVVVNGNSFIDQATITGESLPVEKLPGAQVYAGTLNQSGSLEVKTVAVGADTAFGKIIHAVEVAEGVEAPIQKTSDRLAGYLIYIALAAAVLTFFVTHNIRATISVILVTGACGVAAGTPLAILGAVGRAARTGAIVKGGLYLEQLATVDTVVMDKTGTVTFGKPEIAAVQVAEGATRQELLQVAAIAERRSEHPLGEAIIRAAQAENLFLSEPDTFSYVPGRGIVCTSDGKQIIAGSLAFLSESGIDLSGLAKQESACCNSTSKVFVALGNRALGVIEIADTIRNESQLAISQLKQLGLHTVMLTGDSDAIAKHVGEQLGFDQIFAEMLPDQKVSYIEELVAKGKKVAFVGDGINDAPALLAATVGAAVGSGVDVARESADIVLIGNNLLHFVDTIKIARRARAIIMFNFIGTIVVDAVGIVLAALGILNPLSATLVHVGSELTFILNSARLLPKVSHKSGITNAD
jgi:Cd2+/Zn2+-exporting ATPase/Cu+-exporting ATPase